MKSKWLRVGDALFNLDNVRAITITALSSQWTVKLHFSSEDTVAIVTTDTEEEAKAIVEYIAKHLDTTAI